MSVSPFLILIIHFKLIADLFFYLVEFAFETKEKEKGK